MESHAQTGMRAYVIKVHNVVFTALKFQAKNTGLNRGLIKKFLTTQAVLASIVKKHCAIQPIANVYNAKIRGWPNIQK